MASPMPMGPMGGSWNGQNGQPPAPAPEYDDSGLQVKPMGLKVHYTFDRDSKVNCLARHPQTLSVQTISIDERNAIGVVDLRACIHAVTECSPELAGRDGDYTIYAVDYSEEDTPLVGQGMLSWALESLHGDVSQYQPKMVTGRVTKNLLGVFGGGSRETLEVRLKLTEAAKVIRPESQRSFEQQPARPMENALTPTSSSEWNHFMQSNPQIGQQYSQQPQQHQQQPPTQQHRIASPALSQGQGQQNQSSATERRGSFGTGQLQFIQAPQTQRIAPTPVSIESAQSAPYPSQGPASRPSSRASNKSTTTRKKTSTGRPRGRPRKKPAEGNTSGYEDGTEGEDAGPPSKKRAKVTQIEKATANPFGSEPESLRVAASTAGSIRNFRPVGANSESGSGSHLKDIPRAPTPVPQNPLLGGAGLRKGKKATDLRRQSVMSQELNPNDAMSFSESRLAFSPGQEDERSPESIVPTPNYSEDSPMDIGSSPPVPRTTTYMRSSPPPSSPILPPMPQAPLPREASLMSTDMEELYMEESFHQQEQPHRNRNRKAVETTTTSGVPFQVFRMTDGPTGDRDLVHIRNCNTPHPTSAPIAPSEGTVVPATQPHPPQPKPKRQRAPRKKKEPKSAPAVPAAGPTPPPTTDAAEKPVSPVTESQSELGTVVEPTTTPAVADPPTSTAQPTEAPTLPLSREHGGQEAMAINKDDVFGDGPETAAVVDTESQNQPDQPNGQLEPDLTMTEQLPDPVLAPSLLPNIGEPQLANAQPPADSTDSAPHKAPRKLNRSQSAGPGFFPAIPASEPAGPSSLSRSFTVDSGPMSVETPATLKRAASTGPLVLPVPASDPVGPTLPPPSSPPNSRSNKNFVKKHAIKQRLEDAILRGEMPPFCSNCGAIETPTWRKIWVQDREGVPEKVEYSEKPGMITAIEILKRGDGEQPCAYRVVKKSLGKDEDRKDWQELLLCNPCGIWLAKCKVHRPADRWEKDASRLGQERRKRTSSNAGNQRSKKAKMAGDDLMNLTSEAYLPTDALGPMEPSSPKAPEEAIMIGDSAQPESRDATAVASRETSTGSEQGQQTHQGLQDAMGSTLSREDGTNNTPKKDGAGLGSTRRLLFPSPRKDDSPKVLGQLDVNVVKSVPECRPKEMSLEEKENSLVQQHEELVESQDDDEDLFGHATPARPSTPPPNAKSTCESSAFKTPTRPTPSHRPITRSVSRSIRSVRVLASPAQLDVLQRTPSKTPHSTRHGNSSSARRRSPRNPEAAFENVFDTPITRSISQLLAEHHGFGLEDQELDLSSLPPLDEDNSIDWGHVFSTDGPMPSSPGKNLMSFDYNGSADVMDQWTQEQELHFQRTRH